MSIVTKPDSGLDVEPVVSRRRLPELADVLRWALALAGCSAFTWFVYSEGDDEIPVRWVVAGTLGVLAVAAPLVHRSPWKLTPYANPALQQIVSALVRRRKLLLVLYLALVSLWFGAALQLSVMVTDIAPMVIGHNASESDGARVVNVIIAAVLLALQAAFLFGAGRVRLDRHTPPQRLVVTVAIFALLMSVLTGVAVATVLQMIGRLDNDIVARPNLVNETTVLAIMGSSWTLWALIGWLAVRDVDRPTALSRLTVGLLAGSWIEFYAALLIELASRERTEACPCASGSWIGLVAAGPIAIWALGPGLFLIYLRARRLRAQESLSALRVLRRKSRRGRTSR